MIFNSGQTLRCIDVMANVDGIVENEESYDLSIQSTPEFFVRMDASILSLNIRDSDSK